MRVEVRTPVDAEDLLRVLAALLGAAFSTSPITARQSVLRVGSGYRGLIITDEDEPDR